MEREEEGERRNWWSRRKEGVEESVEWEEEGEELVKWEEGVEWRNQWSARMKGSGGIVRWSGGIRGVRGRG